MTIILKPEQEQVLLEAINSGLAHTTDEALDQALRAGVTDARIVVE